MFEDYLQDAYNFASEAKNTDDDRQARRLYRAAVFHAGAALEAFVNFVGDTLQKGDKFAPYEIAFLNDKKFALSRGTFEILEQTEFHRLEDKLIFLLTKFDSHFDRATNPAWSRFLEFKQFRDAITHPRSNDDESAVADYEKNISSGLGSVIELIDSLCKAIFGKRLRPQIRDLCL